MATQTRNLRLWNDTDAMLRAWAAGIHAAILAVGLTIAEDSGQANLATITVPGANVTSAGYRIYAFAGNEFFLRVDFATSQNFGGEGTDGASLWFTVGTTTDGAGTMTGNVSTKIRLDFGTDEGTRSQFISGDGGKTLALALNAGVSGKTGSVVTFGKSRNSSGALTAEFLHIAGMGILGDGGALGVTNRPSRFQQLVYTQAEGGSQPATGNLDYGFYTIWPPTRDLAAGTAHTSPGNSTMSSALGLGIQPIFPFRGYPGNWCLDLAYYFEDDIPAGQTVPLMCYGSLKTWLCPGAIYCNMNNLPNSNRIALAIPWE